MEATEIETLPEEVLEGLPDPLHRIREGASGTPVILADGREWLLADGGLLNALDEIRDRIFDDSQLDSSVLAWDVQQAAWFMLLANYRIEPSEAARLILGCNPKRILAAVAEALFGPRDPAISYTDWAASTLLANGLDPDKIPGRLRPLVLDQLVATGRAIPCAKFCDAANVAIRRESLRALAGSESDG